MQKKKNINMTQLQQSRPEINGEYSDREGNVVRVHAMCHSHVVFRHQPFNELDVNKRQEFYERYLTK